MSTMCNHSLFNQNNIQFSLARKLMTLPHFVERDLNFEQNGVEIIRIYIF